MSEKMTWGSIREQFVRMCGGAGYAEQDCWLHINWAHERLFDILDVPEVKFDPEQVTILAGTDNVAIPPRLYAIDGVVELATGRRLDPESGGWVGRTRYYLPGTGMPPRGSLSYYWRRGEKLYLRDVPDVDTDILVSYRFHPDNVGDGDLDFHPIVDTQYHFTIIRLAAANYWEMYPPDGPDGTKDFSVARNFKQAAMEDVGLIKNELAEERSTARNWFYQPGYDFNVR